MSVVLQVPYRCPECEQVFLGLGWVSTSSGPDCHTDLHRPSLGASILPAMVAVCPHCGCADWTAEFDHGDDDSDDLPAAEVQGAAGYAEAARQAAERGVSAAELATIWLRGSWCARDLRDPDLEAVCQRHALECYRAAWEIGSLPRRERQTAGYLIGELQRRLGEPAGALAWWDEHLSGDDCEDWAALLDVVRPLAKAGDASDAMVSGVRFGPRPPALEGPQAEAMAAIREGSFGAAIDLDDPSLAPHLLDALEAGDSASQHAARMALEVLAPVMLEPLLESADQESVPRMLADVGDPRALQPLLSVLRGRRRPRQDVVEALVKLGDRRAFGPLSELFGKPRWTPGLAIALPSLGGKLAHDLLWRRLVQARRSESRELIQALDLLGALQDPSLARQASDLVGLAGGEIIARVDPEGTAERLTAILPELTGQALLDAAQWLFHLGRAPSAELLLPLLTGHSESIVREVLLLLGRLGDALAVEPLIAWLTRPWQDPRGYNALEVDGSWREEPSGRYRNEASDLDRLPAIWALGQLRDPRAYETLLALTAAPARLMRPYAVHALGCLGDVRALEPLLALAPNAAHELSQPAIVALGELGDPRAAQSLLPILSGDDHRVRPAIEALGKIGGEVAVDGLIEHLSGAKPPYAEAAIQALARTRDGRAFALLKRLLDQRQGSVVAAAAAALGDFGDTSVIPALERLLAYNWHVKQAAIKSLSQLGRAVPKVPYVSPPHVVPLEGWYPLPALLRDLASDEHYDRQPAVRALEQDDAAELLVPLAQYLGEDEQGVRTAAAEALRLVCAHLKRHGRSPDEAAVEVLCRWLLDDRLPVRLLAAEHLALFDTDQAREALLLAATDGSVELRCAAVRALAAAGDPEATPTLIDALADPEPLVRAAACEAVNDPRAAAAFLTAADDPDPTVRSCAVAALAWFGDARSMARARDALNAPNEAVRDAARTALSQPEPAEVAPAAEKPATVSRSVWLRGLSGGHDASCAVHLVSDGLASAIPALVRHRARREVSDEQWAEALTGAGPDAVEVLSGLLAQVDPARRAAAADALGRFGDPRASAALLPAMGDEAVEVRVAAVGALGRLADATAEEPLCVALRGADVALRAAAVRALGAYSSPQALAAVTAALDDEVATVRKQALVALRVQARRR